LDRTTIWLRENVRERLRSSPDVLLATVLFRWINRITTGEAIFCQASLDIADDEHGNTHYVTAWEDLLSAGSTEGVRHAIRQYCGKGPYVTGSYIIKTPDGRDKLDGVLWCVEQFMTREVLHFEGCSTQREVAQYLLDHPGEVSLADVWCWLKDFPYLGAFMAYEIVTDLRHTDLLCNAPDIMTWANPGPGAMRGLNRLAGRDLNKRLPRQVYIEEMRELLRLSQDKDNWPQLDENENIVGCEDKIALDVFGWDCQTYDWPALEMRDIEHSLCELDKLMRCREGGKTKQRFRVGS